MFNKVIAVTLLCCFVPILAHATLVYPPEPHVKVTLKTKQGTEYQFRETYDIDHGIASYQYDFGRKGTFKSVYSGETGGEEEVCPDKNDDYQIKKAIIKHSYSKQDINRDGVQDLILNIVEENCKTGKKSKIVKQIISTKTGFEVK